MSKNAEGPEAKRKEESRIQGGGKYKEIEVSVGPESPLNWGCGGMFSKSGERKRGRNRQCLDKELATGGIRAAGGKKRK